tara:strand:+ start:1042 stop:2091 length:1050 start_codon:yes stop_codon:yes gene_type:complete
MPAKPLNKTILQESLDAVARHESVAAAARALNVAESTLRSRIMQARKQSLVAGQNNPPPLLPDFGEEDIPIENIINHMSERFKKQHAHHKAREWFDIDMPDNKPMALCLMGDPHVDDNGCNWPLLREDCDIMATTPGMYCVQMGDASNAWAGRLMRLWADQDSSRNTAYRLVEWLMVDSGVKYLLCLLGNHDTMSAEHAYAIKQMLKNTVQVFDWQAKFNIAFPNGKKCPTWLAHSMKGTSIYNILHGPMRASKFASLPIRVLGQGHHHEWGYFVTEDVDTKLSTHLIKTRGYKYVDDYANRHQFGSQDDGATMSVVIDPRVEESHPGFIRVFEDLRLARDYLTYLRSN